MTASYHESAESLSPATRDMHRALVSLIEELEAVDSYQQRAEASPDAALATVLVHHRDEEIEHAAMLLEWLRRRVPEFDSALRTYLFTDAPITEVEAGATAGAAPAAATAKGSLGIGGR